MKQIKVGYTEGKVGRKLLFNSLPMVIGIGAAIAFNFIDTVFVAKLGTTELAAIGFTFPVIFLIVGVAMGLGQGSSAVISKAYGEGDTYKVKRLTTDSLILALLAVAFFTTIGFIFMDDIFKLMGAGSDTMPHIQDYMVVWYSGVIFLVVPMVGNANIRAIGDTKYPSMLMLLAIGINLIFDPLLIFGLGPFPRLEIAGAAYATLIARFFTLTASILLLTKKYDMITLKRCSFSDILLSWKEILNVGLPSALTSIIVPLGYSIIVRFVSEFGKEAVAALTAASRVETLALTVFMALASVLGPFIGQNWGAKKTDRIFRALKLSYLFSIAWGILMIVFFYTMGEFVAKIVEDNELVIKYMVLYFGILSLVGAFRGITMISTTTFNVLKKPITSASINVSQMFILFIPLALYLSDSMGLEGIFWASFASVILTSGVAYFWLNSYLKNLFEPSNIEYAKSN